LSIICPMHASADLALAERTVLPAYVLQLPASVRSVLIAETDTSTLVRFSYNDGRLQARDDRYMSIGQNGPGKVQSGDRRTPLGIYFANDQLDTRRMHEKYGPMAFPLDYPNAWDTIIGRSGDGIWIHGVVPNSGRRPPLDTDGCIAVSNADLLELEGFIRLLATPVIITRKIQSVAVQELDAMRDELNGALHSWAESYRDGDWHRFLSLYAAEFEYRGLNRDEWAAYRVRAGNTRPLMDFSVDEVLLLKDPEDESLFLSRFQQTIDNGDGQIVTIKRLYWRLNAHGQFKIVAEDNG